MSDQELNPDLPPEGSLPPGDAGGQDDTEDQVEGPAIRLPERPAGGADPAVDLGSDPSAAEEVAIDRAGEAARAQAGLVQVEPLAGVRGDGGEAPSGGRRPSGAAGAAVAPADARLTVDHVPSCVHAYPGEDVTFLTRVLLLEDVPGLIVRVQLPQSAAVLEAHAPEAAGLYVTEVGDASHFLRWQIGSAVLLEKGNVLEFSTLVRVPGVETLVEQGPLPDAADLVCHAEAAVLADERPPVRPAGESAVVAVRAKGSYLKHLPAVYERDSFMARFLMLFESFWAPIHGQVANIPDYFDSAIAPLSMVRWLADKLDLLMAEDWPEETQRAVVRRAVSLYRRRGTRQGLTDLLQLYTGAPVRIVERRANNFRLGSGARLGQGVALGARNQPHSFSVSVRLPMLAEDPARPGWAEKQRERRRERIRTLIEDEKPAHVTYTLEIDEITP